MALLGCVTVTIGCIRDVFIVEGEIVSSTGSTIEGARCYFVDTGLDDWRQGEFESPAIGQSDNFGRLRAEYEYFWGHEVRRKRPESYSTEDRWFSIVIRADGYEEAATRVEYDSLVFRDDGSANVSLGSVVLVPELDSPVED